ncbi:MAG: hypothetical protein LBB90_02385 [Tannerella sp.]|jgi:hypothetical protein|nr:hypothetical protein [Tannerella sp.]
MPLKKCCLFCLLLSLCQGFTMARNNLRFPDTRTLGMGGNGASHSSLFNPALLALQEQKDVRIDYFNRYGIKELATVSGAFCFPNRILPAGLHVASFGYDEYRESMFRLSTGKRLNAFWTLGISVQYAVIQSQLFESDASRLSTDIGASFQPVDNCLITCSAINVPSISLNSEEVDSERIGTYLIELGVNWQLVNNLLITGSMAHNRETRWEASLGMEYRPYDDFHLRSGVRTAPFRPSLGAGYRFAGLIADVVMIYHPVLGISTGLGLSFSF